MSGTGGDGGTSLNAKSFEWDTACPATQRRHSHNYMHHPFTNIVGKDRDIGYGILRMSGEERWRPYYLGNPAWAALLAVFFQYGVALHDLEAERIAAGEVSWTEKRGMLADIWRKVKGQTLKDYLLFPLLSGPSAPFVLAGNATANLTHNLWAFTIIFCRHFPAGTREFTQEEADSETRGEWYYRQLLGSANLSGGELFHALAGNLSHQIEHHLFPDPPAPLRRDCGRRPRDLRAPRDPLQHRPAVQAVRQRRAQDRQARPAATTRPRELQAGRGGGHQRDPAEGAGGRRARVDLCL